MRCSGTVWTQEYTKHTEGHTGEKTTGGSKSTGILATNNPLWRQLQYSLKTPLPFMEVNQGQQLGKFRCFPHLPGQQPAAGQTADQQTLKLSSSRDPGSLSSGLAELGNNESARNILVLSPLSLYPPGTQQVK